MLLGGLVRIGCRSMSMSVGVELVLGWVDVGYRSAREDIGVW